MLARPDQRKPSLADADAVADRIAARLHQIEHALLQMDDDRAGLLAGRIDDDLAAEFRLDLLIRHLRQLKPSSVKEAYITSGLVMLLSTLIWGGWRLWWWDRRPGPACPMVREQPATPNAIAPRPARTSRREACHGPRRATERSKALGTARRDTRSASLSINTPQGSVPQVTNHG